MFLEIIATLAAGLFAGAAIFINLVEHPARMEGGTAAALKEWRPSYKRATLMQVPLAAVREGWYWDRLSVLDHLRIMEHPGLFLTHEGF